MTTWTLRPDVAISPDLAEAVGGHPLVAEILVRRGIQDRESALAFLQPEYYSPSPPTDLPDLEKAAALLWEVIRKGQRILVWGDFDVDGQTSTALLTNALRDLGADVEYHIPHRILHGHGVQLEILKDYFGKIDILLTCDTGIAAHEAIDAAQANGITVLVTDHHALPPDLPDALAVVNPQRLPEGHPLRDLPGVGVTYKLVQQLYLLADQKGAARKFLDLVALGIVCDVATQLRDTRYLLQLGIDELRHPKRTGLQALMHSAGVDVTTLSSDTIGFQIGPRLNALGRLDHAKLSVELLSTSDMGRAQQIAAQLEILNQRRRQIEDQIYGAAQEQIARDPALLGFEALVLDNPHWHPGVIGIVASRLVEQYGKPTLLLATPEGKPAGGSARSVPGVDIGACIAANADILIGHGGHPGAAGVRLDPDLIPQFRRRLSNTVRETRDPTAATGYVIDLVLPLAEVTMELAEELNRLAPFGQGNPPIHLMTPGLKPVSSNIFGVNGKHRRVLVEDGVGKQYPITWWRGGDYHLPEHPIDLITIPRINDYKGRRSLQLEWVDARVVPGIEVETGPRFTVVDLRADPAAVGDVLPDECLIWAEALDPGEMPYDADRIVNRDRYERSRTLLIWTAPPGPSELREMLDSSGARSVHVLAAHGPEDSPPAFLRRLAGLVKYALRAYEGEIRISQLASATAQREMTVRRGLEFMAAKGQVSVDWLDGETLRLREGGEESPEAVEPALDAVKAMLAEAAAFRAFFRQAPLDAFFK